MKKDLEEIFNNAKKVSLTESERSLILNRIIDPETIDTVRNISSPRLYSLGGVATLTHYYSRFGIVRFRTMLSICAIMIALLGTTGAYAQMSLPGDLLYPIKIHISEKLEYVIAITPKAQAVLEATFATRRLEEAAALLYANKLTARQSTELAGEFSTYTEKLVGHLSELRSHGDGEDANRINSSFTASLQTHQEILNVFAASSSLHGGYMHNTEATSTEIQNSARAKTNNNEAEKRMAPSATTTLIMRGNEASGTSTNTKQAITVEVSPEAEQLPSIDSSSTEKVNMKNDFNSLPTLPSSY